MNNILILGAAGFIGTNLTLELVKEPENKITAFDRAEADFSNILRSAAENVSVAHGMFDVNSDFEAITKNQDVVYHLVSTTIPGNANQHIAEEMVANVVATVKLLDACVKNKVREVVFLSSGGTVYGKENEVPLNESASTYPISSYGLQKITIEKLLYLYEYLYGLDYRIVRLANPFGPYQRPNGVLGVVTTFVYKILKEEPIVVYGDGSVVRDFIYIDDAIRGILNIANTPTDKKLFNLGSGNGTSIRQVIETISSVLHKEPIVEYRSGRKADVPVNILDIGLYESIFGELKPMTFEVGIKCTAQFMREVYDIHD